MHSQDDQEKELRRRERELQEREHAIRLRELEAEINKPLDPVPLYKTTKHQEGKSFLQRWGGKLANVGKFLALVVVVVITIKVATQVGYVVIVGAIAWIAYKIFFDGKNSKN